MHAEHSDSCEQPGGSGPTLASEKLEERDGIDVSKAAVGQIMIAGELHEPKACLGGRGH